MANYKTCRECNSALLDDDIAIYRKLIYRGADEFLCIDCLGKQLGCTRDKIEQLIKYYRESGQWKLFG